MMDYPTFKETTKKIIFASEFVETKWTSSTTKYYQSLGYEYTKQYDHFWVHIKDLPLGSDVVVRVICPVCSVERDVQYKCVSKNGHSLCRRCVTTKNLIGHRFGRLIAMHPDPDKPMHWLCKCDCGKTTSVMGQSLTRNATKSCGCYTRDYHRDRGNSCHNKMRKDLTGLRFGKLVVAQKSKKTGDKRKRVYWDCYCDCGGKATTTTTKLTSGHTSSCGCSFYRKGENHPNWDDTLEDRDSRRSWDESFHFRNAVFDRDKYTCQACGDNKGGNLVAHHLYDYSHYPQHRADINNGITLCEDCHTDFHSSSGGYQARCTPDNYYNWLRNKIS